MPDRTPIETRISTSTAMLRCRGAGRAIFWRLEFFGRPAFLGTMRPDGRPHSAGIGTLWIDGDIYFTSGPGTRKVRNLAENPACTISAGLATIDIVFEGEAVRVTDGLTLERVAARCRESGWPVQVEGGAFTGPLTPRALDHRRGIFTALLSTPPLETPRPSRTARRADLER